MDKLVCFLAKILPGPIARTAELERLLAECWDELAGGDGGGMKGYKLLGRMKSLSWDQPKLAFEIERHGGTVQGSSTAEVQHWTVTVDQKTAAFGTGKYHQVRPRQPSLEVQPLVEEVARRITARQEDDRLVWRDDGSVKVLISRIIPKGSAVKQTLAGRRKRFWMALVERLRAEGWFEHCRCFSDLGERAQLDG
jgi:hypothetical protein